MIIFWESYRKTATWGNRLDITEVSFNFRILNRFLIFVFPLSIEFLVSLTPVQFLSYAAAAKSRQSCPTLCDPIDGSPPGSSVPGILQARTLEWVAISFSKPWEWKVKVKSLSHVQLCNPMDCSLPGSSIHGIFQARVLEWFAVAFSVWGIS